MGPNTENEDTLREMIIAGMDVARFNFSHGTHEEQLAKFNLLKKVREELEYSGCGHAGYWRVRRSALAGWRVENRYVWNPDRNIR